MGCNKLFLAGIDKKPDGELCERIRSIRSCKYCDSVINIISFSRFKSSFQGLSSINIPSTYFKSVKISANIKMQF